MDESGAVWLYHMNAQHQALGLCPVDEGSADWTQARIGETGVVPVQRTYAVRQTDYPLPAARSVRQVREYVSFGRG